MPSPNSAQAIGILPMTLHVNVGAKRDAAYFILANIAHPASRRTNDHRIVGELLSLGDERTGSDQAIPPDARAIEHDRPHADQRIVSDRAAMQDDVVADHAITSDRQRETGVGV